MQIKRDYSQPFFGAGPRRRRSFARVLLFVGLIFAIVLVFVIFNLSTLQQQTMDWMGLAPTPTPLPSDLATIASNMALAGDVQGATALFEQVVRQRPDNIDYLYEFGRLLIDQANYDLAIQMADHAIEVDLTDPRGYALKAEVLVYTGAPSTAIPVALSGIEVNRDFAPLYAALARAYADTGRYDDSLEMGALAVDLAPYSADARRSYAYALTMYGLGTEATAQLEQAIMVDPIRIPTYFELAFQYLAQNRDQEAIDIYDRILAMQPRNARAMLRLCGAYRKIGQFERAFGYCQDSVSANPNSAEAQFELGRMQYNNRQFAEALTSFQACVSINPASLECTYRSGLAHFYLGDCDTAWSVLRNSLIMARARTGTERAISDITAGLNEIGQQCPQYGGLAPEIIEDDGEDITVPEPSGGS